MLWKKTAIYCMLCNLHSIFYFLSLALQYQFNPGWKWWDCLVDYFFRERLDCLDYTICKLMVIFTVNFTSFFVSSARNNLKIVKQSIQRNSTSKKPLLECRQEWKPIIHLFFISKFVIGANRMKNLKQP